MLANSMIKCSFGARRAAPRTTVARRHFQYIRCRADDNNSSSSNGKRPPYGSDIESSGEFCAPAFVNWDNDTDKEATKLSLTVVDYPGLLHVISWVLKGMEVRVKAAELKTSEDGMANDVFFLTTISGKPLPDGRAREVADRVSDFVMYCSPKSGRQAVEWHAGPVFISNDSHDSFSEVTVLEDQLRVGFLLQITSVMTGVGVEVREAHVRSCTECEKDPAFDRFMEDPSHVRSGRVIKLLVCEADGAKLSERSVNTVMYTLGLVIGQGHAPTVVPTSESYAVKFADSNL